MDEKSEMLGTKYLKESEKYIPYKLIEDNISFTDIKKQTIEERSTNLFYETLTGKGKLFLKNGLLYYGPVKYGILSCEDPSDECEIKFPDGTIYVGQIKNNEITGTGKYFFPNGTTYIGEVLNGFRHGFGKFESKKEELSYEGNWKNGLKNGFGTMKKKGSTYEGNWKDGFIDGKGKLKWKSGNVYKGDFKLGKMDGNGYMIWFNEHKKYSGEWKNNIQNGFGVEIWYEEKGEHKYLFNRYIGEWKEGKRDGYGIFYYSNGAKYEGTWKNDNKEGFGVFTYNDGRKYSGLFQGDNFCGNEQNQITESAVLKYLNDYKAKLLKHDKPKKKKTGKKIAMSVVQTNKPTQKPNLFSSVNPNLNNNKKIQGNTKLVQSVISPIRKVNENVKSPDSKNIDSTPISKQPSKNVSIDNTSKILKKENSNNIELFDKFHINYKVILEPNKDKEVQKTKYNKSLNKFIPFLQFKKISLMEPDIFNYRKEIENLILQNLTEIRRWYQYSNRLALESEENRLKREAEIYSPHECAYTNKIYLCMELKDLWRLFRDSGIMAAPFSLSCFDRLFYHDSFNKCDILFVERNIQEDDAIYKELYEKINNSKINFSFENQAYILYYYLTTKSDSTQYLFDLINNESNNVIIDDDNLEEKISEIEEENEEKELKENPNLKTQNNMNKDLFDENNDYIMSEKDIKYLKSNKFGFDINNSHNPLLLYQFYNSLFYAAILYYSYYPNDFNAYQKFRRIIDFINSAKPNFKRGGSKTKTGMSKLESSFVVKANEALNEAQRLRNYDYFLIDDFYKEYSIKLIPIFEKLFFLSKHGKFYDKNDKTIEYSYFYYHILKKINLLSDIFSNKAEYAEIISHFHTSIIDNKKDKEKENQIKESAINSKSNKNDTNVNINNKISSPLKPELISSTSKPIDNKQETNNNNNENNNNENKSNTDDEEDSVLEEFQKMMNTDISTLEDITLKYKQISELFYSEMNYYEFIELIFFICRKYYLKQNPNAIFIEMQVPKKEKTKEKQKELMQMKQKEKETFMEIINLIYQEVNEFEKKSKEPSNRGKFAYKFPELKSHRLKREQIKEKEKMREMMRLKQKEIERYNLERKNFMEEDKNVYVEEQPEENDDSSEEDFD